MEVHLLNICSLKAISQYAKLDTNNEDYAGAQRSTHCLLGFAVQRFLNQVHTVKR